jgi:hypothetical protein
MTIDEASRIIGSQTKICVRDMHRALELMTWLNTATERRRLEAAAVVLRNWPAHQRYLNAQRNAQLNRLKDW